MAKIRDVDGAREFVREHSDLAEIVSGYGYEFSPFSEDHVVCPCPFHEEEKPSFAVSASKQLYICYGCKEGGDVFSFIQKIEGLNHVEAIRRLAEIAGISISQFESEETEEEKRANRLIQFCEKALAKATKDLKKKAQFNAWVNSRVLDLETLKTYGIGYTVSPPFAGGTEVEELGLDRRFQWSNAIVVPIKDSAGRPVAFRNRPLDGDTKTVANKKSHPLQVPSVYGYSEAKKAIREAGGVVILVEGEVDVWQMSAFGFENTCGTFGTSFGEDGLNFLADRGINEAIILPDGDEGGRKLAARMSRLHHKDIAVKIASIQDGDPDEILLEEGRPAIEDVLAQAKYGIEYLVEDALRRPILTITDRLDVLIDLKPVLSECTRAEEDLAIGLLSEALDMDPASVLDFFRDVDPGDSKLYDVKTERVIIARMLRDQEFIGEVIQGLTAEDFHMVRHGQIFDAVAKLYRKGHTVDQDTVAITLERAGADSAIRVLEGIADLGQVTVSSFMLDALREMSMRRQIQDVSKGVIADAANPTIDPHVTAQSMMTSVSQIIVGGSDAPKDVDRLVDNFVEVLHERIKAPDLIVGHDLGRNWQTLNRTIHGLQAGRFVVFAAPSGVGKTSVAVDWTAQLGVELQIPTLFLTLETDAATLTQRLISRISGVEQESMSTGFITPKDLDLIHDAGARIAASPIKIAERGRTLEECQAIVLSLIHI